MINNLCEECHFHYKHCRCKANSIKVKKMKTKTVDITYKKFDGGYCPTFKIGAQTFHLQKLDTKKEAIFFCEMLGVAFDNLAKPYFGEGKAPSFEKNCFELANPQIKVLITTGNK